MRNILSLSFFNKLRSQWFDDGYSKGYSEGFTTGSKKALAESKRVFAKRLKKEIDSSSNLDYVLGLKKAIELIKK